MKADQTDAHADVDAASLVTCDWPLVFQFGLDGRACQMMRPVNVIHGGKTTIGWLVSVIYYLLSIIAAQRGGQQQCDGRGPAGSGCSGPVCQASGSQGATGRGRGD